MMGLLAFDKTLALVEAGNYDEAATEMLNSRWATQVGARATRLSQQMRTGQWV
jgi:lysozyme